MKYISPWIYTTYSCNFACPYCYVRQDNSVMNKSVFSQIDYVFRGLLDSHQVENVIFRIAGGEPLLVFNNWKTIFSDIKFAYSHNTFISILTNLSLLNDEHIDYIINNNCGLGISLDGYYKSKPYHNGESSASVVRANIDKLISKRGNNNIDITTVIDKYSINELPILASWIAERNINWNIDLNHYFIGELSSIDVCSKMIAVIDILNNSGYDIINRFKFNNIKFTKDHDGCTAGNRLCAIGVNGEVWQCQTQQGNTPLFNIFDGNFLSNLSRKYGNISLLRQQNDILCNECPITEYCHGGCVLHNGVNNKKYICNIDRFVSYYILNTILGGENA